MMARWLVLPVLALLVVACGDDKPSLLRRHVEGFCQDIHPTLQSMKDSVMAAAADAGATESSHPFSDSNVRRERSADLRRRFAFCLAVRDAKDPTKARIEKSYGGALATLRGDVLGPGPSAEAVLQAIEQLERTMQEIDELPLRD